MKNIPWTLYRYLGRVYALSFLALLGILLAIVYLFDTVELLRRAAKFDDIPLLLVLQMGLLKLPEVGQVILPFAVLFSALYTFWLLARRAELVILRAAGLSVWQFLSPVIGVAVLLGILHMMVINPLGALLIARYHALEVTYLNAEANTVSISEQGLWLRQKTPDGHVILHAEGVEMPAWLLRKVTVFKFNENLDFTGRIDAKGASLTEGNWTFEQAVINNVGNRPVMKDRESIATELTITEIEESFSSPEETPFWALPGYIKTMEMTGFDARKLKVHFQSLLAQPLLFAAMVILAATVSLKVARFQATTFMIGSGVVIGFMVFFASSLLQALGASDQIPVFLAAWFPPLIALSLGISVILNTEDG